MMKPIDIPGVFIRFFTVSGFNSGNSERLGDWSSPRTNAQSIFIPRCERSVFITNEFSEDLHPEE